MLKVLDKGALEDGRHYQLCGITLESGKIFLFLEFFIPHQDKGRSLSIPILADKEEVFAFTPRQAPPKIKKEDLPPSIQASTEKPEIDYGGPEEG